MKDFFWRIDFRGYIFLKGAGDFLIIRVREIDEYKWDKKCFAVFVQQGSMSKTGLWRHKMPKRRKTKKQRTEVEELVIIAYAEDLEQARDFETILKSNEIPAMIKKQEAPQDNGRKSIAIMVPEEYTDEANVVIESQNAYDDVYDLAIEQEEEEDFGSEPFEDEL